MFVRGTTFRIAPGQVGLALERSETIITQENGAALRNLLPRSHLRE
jgi:hypothetical protein